MIRYGGNGGKRRACSDAGVTLELPQSTIASFMSPEAWAGSVTHRETAGLIPLKGRCK
jgi:hypothetical protein